jgi:hypothetical protein
MLSLDQDMLKFEQMATEKVYTDDNEARMFTMVVTRDKPDVCCRLAGMSVSRQWDPP